MDFPAPRRHGTQSLERAVLVLRKLAERGALGWRLLDLAEHCDIERTTVHRILSSLVRQRLAEQRPADRRYVPGPLLFELSLSMPSHAAFQAACAAPLARVVKRLGGVGYVSLRSGAEFVCTARAGVPMKALTIRVGSRRPLMTAVGGIAILIALPNDERRRLVAENRRELARFPAARRRDLESTLRRSQSRGYAISQGEIVPGIGACGVPIGSFAAVTLVKALEDMPPSRVPDVVAALKECAAQVEAIRDLKSTS
ncbi:MAG TPA: helix-turn-helix domain-containing protein [Burkholderiales bacterium]|nr:helix-turn-helix domain-containing protein [Burkholderiales bacterium]